MLLLLLLGVAAHASAQTPSFDVTSVRRSQRQVGPDYNNQFTYSPSAFTARNATLKALVAEAYRVQRRQVFGPAWIDQEEFDIEARASGPSTREQISNMLRGLLAERFSLKQHTESRVMRAFELMPAKSGPKLQPVKEGESAKPAGGVHFRGDMREFADFLAVKVSMRAPTDPNVPSFAGGPPVPVLDKTGLEGIYDFHVDVRPELGADGLTLWQRALPDQLGLRLESGRAPVPVLVIDEAAKVPTAN